MHHVSYRSKLRLRKLLIGLAIALVVLIAAAIGLFLYLQRYIVYTPEGARLDFSARPSPIVVEEQPLNPNFVVETPDDAQVPSAGVMVDDEPEEEAPAFPRISGYYIDVSMLARPEAVLEAVDALETPVSILVDVRSIYGNYYYHTATAGAELSTAVDASEVDRLIEALSARDDVYLIARLPAFRDSAFALANQSSGLALSGGALWMDEENCYWLDPASDLVRSRLEGSALELQALGFDEVVFRDFYFPASPNIAYQGDGGGAVLEAAGQLAAALSRESIVLSIETDDPALAPYAARIYVTESNGARVQTTADTFAGVCDPLEDRLVFLTSSRDTRFSEYGLLKPLLSE